MVAERIADGLYRVLKGYVNAYVLEDDAGLVLVDCGLPKRADRIAASIRETGHQPADVRHILVTHHHLDHTGSLAAMAKETGASVYVHRADAAVVRGDSMPPPPNPAMLSGRTLGRVVLKIGPRRADPSKVDEELVDGQELPMAGGLLALHTPGHTAGQTSFLLERDGGILIAGDAARAFGSRIGPPTGAIFGMFTEDLEEAKRSFRRLAELEFEVAVFGHGTPCARAPPRHFARSPRARPLEPSPRRAHAEPSPSTRSRHAAKLGFVIRIALGQINSTVGDLDGNVEKMAEWTERATEAGADLVCFPELAVTGYPPEDLVLRPQFVRDNLEALDELARRTSGGCAVLTGFVDRTPLGLHNAAGLLAHGEVVARYHKVRLPNYGVFDEQRYFVPGETACPVRVNSSALGISVCEDAWWPGPPWEQYARVHAAVIPNINGSPYYRGKSIERLEVARARARESGAWIVYVNAVGGQDELVFDGGSMVVSPSGELSWHAAMFDEDLLVVDLLVPEAPPDYPGPVIGGTAKPEPPDPRRDRWPDGIEEVYRALVLGLGDYVRKNWFREALVGLSGGIDSALVATLAADALGPHAVRALAMPSPYSSAESVEDATAVAGRLGIRLDEVRIDDVFKAYLSVLEDLFRDTSEGVAEENLQARIRGNLLMALSNKFGMLVLATGNKSEMAVGYSTLYGDLAGGFAPIKDVPKTLVYELARWRNGRSDPAPIPDSVLSKPPSAELRPDQKDSDSLPPYEELDPIIEAYVEEDRSPDEIVAAGTDASLVERVVAMIDRAEYKRRQAPPGVKITPKAFGRDRRLPMTNAYGRAKPPRGPAGPVSRGRSRAGPSDVGDRARLLEGPHDRH
jgi:NAD+ synthase (glutamine-hydrolysing)